MLTTSPCSTKIRRIWRRRAPMAISTAISRARSATVIVSTTRIFSPATNVISPMKSAVTSFSRLSARNSARFSSIQVVDGETLARAAQQIVGHALAASSSFVTRTSSRLTTSPTPASACAEASVTNPQFAS